MTLYQILTSSGYPASEVVFPANATVTLPFILYETVRQNNMNADNKTYKVGDVVQIRLVNLGERPDTTAKLALETALKTNEIPFEMVDGFHVESEGTYETIYEIGVMR